MKKNLFLSVILLFFGMQIILAQSIECSETYFFTRGCEAYQDDNHEEAYEYLSKELDNNPKNGYAYALIAALYAYQEEYGQAFISVNLAMKFIPKEDKVYRALAYYVRSIVYNRGLGENEKALADLTSAINEDENDPTYYKERANIYYNMAKYDLSDEDYRKVISIEPHDLLGYVGVGRNANAEKRYEDAIKQFNYAFSLGSKYPEVYYYRAESYVGLRRYEEAIDDIIHALDINYYDDAFQLMLQVADYALVPLVAKLKIQSTKDPDSPYWPYCIGVVLEMNGAYKSAIDYLINNLEKDPGSFSVSRIANCYCELGDFNSALEYIDKAIAIDSTNYNYLRAKADFLYKKGDSKAAILEMDKFVAHYPDNYVGYYLRGQIKGDSNDIDGAIEDYSMSIMFNPYYAKTYCGRGDMYSNKGDTRSATDDYLTVIELDTIPDSQSCAQYAYWGLNQKGKAIEFMNNVIANDSNNADNYYQAACLHSLMGELEKSIEYLQKALEKGFHHFAHIEMDDKLDSVRQLPKFKQLIQQYNGNSESEIDESGL